MNANSSQNFFRCFRASAVDFLLASAVVLTLTLAHSASATSLSGALEFGATSSGNYASGGNVWNTVGGDRFVNLFLANGTTLTSPFINGPDDAHAAISITLALGTHSYGLWAGGGDTSFTTHGFSLFFNGSSTPAISVFAPNQTVTNPPFPASQKNASVNTLDLNGNSAAAANSLSFQDGNTLVTLTGYTWANPSVYNVDRISAPFGSFGTVGQDGVPDWVGQFTIDVSAVPEPTTFALAAFAGTLGALSRIGRRHGSVPRNCR